MLMTRFWSLGACALLLCACSTMQQGSTCPEGYILLSGRAVDESGAGLSGVLIRILWSGGPDSPTFILNGLGLHPRRQERHALASTITDHLGHYAVPVPAWFRDMKPADSVLLASKNGYGSVDVSAYCLFGDTPSTIVLADEEWVTGEVCDEHGAPVVGARIGVLNDDVEVAHVYSDETGGFRFGGVTRRARDQTLWCGNMPKVRTQQETMHIGSGATAVVASRSPTDLGTTARLPDRGVPLRMTLPRGSSKTIQVLDAAGIPLRNEPVAITLQGESKTRWTELLTDDDGIVVIDGFAMDPAFLSCMGTRIEIDSGVKSVVGVSTVRQFALEVVDDESGLGLSDVIIFPSVHTAACVFLDKESWRSGNNVSFVIGRYALTFMVPGHVSWTGLVIVDKHTQALKIRLKKKV